MRMERRPKYDVAVLGGGLAGLAASIQLRKRGYQVVLFEKEAYPFHKVCGEYISLESWEFLLSLGLPLADWNLPRIDTLQLTAPNGSVFSTPLPLGGFGISRFKLDSELAAIARGLGVNVLEKTKVDAVEKGDPFRVHFRQQQVDASICLAAYGKRSNLDVRWNRAFLQQHDKRLNNFIGVKYHLRTDWPMQTIGLHNFENGYCGISHVEDGTVSLCYLTRADNLKQNGNNIRLMEQNVLFRNRHLKKILEHCEVVQEFPITISQISFAQKSRVEDGILMLGDTAGMITPLCGNGMSIALHTAKIAAGLSGEYLKGRLSPTQLTSAYNQQWQQQFASRLRTGRLLQRFFGRSTISNLFVDSFKRLPFLAKPVIRLTHGKPF